MAWWRRLLIYARPELPSLAAILGLTLVTIGFDVLRPWPMKLLVDNVLGGAALPAGVAFLEQLPGSGSVPGMIGLLAAATVILYVLGQLANLLRSYIQAGAGTRMVYQLGGDLFSHMQSLTPRFHGAHTVGDLTRRVTTDASCVRNLITGVGIPVVTALVRLAVMFVVMWKLDPALALLALLVAPAIGVLIRHFDRPMTERTYQQQQLEGEVMALAEQTLTSLPVVQAFGRESQHDREFRTLSERSVRASLDATLSQLQFKIGVAAASAVGTAAMMVIGGLHVLDGSLSVGELLVFLAYLAALYAPMETLAYSFTGFAAAAASARRVFDVLDSQDGVRDTPGAAVLHRVKGEVAMDAVTFGYGAESPVLKGISFHAHPGETVALVGGTGSGKSTLASLVPRFFDPWSGVVRVDGHDVRSVTLTSLRMHIALVLQEPFLLPLSIRDNIAYGTPGATDRDVQEAAVNANAHAFISKLPGGYDTVIGERGSTLSGGEKQRISIARAFLRNAPVLILDEPTSALDAETEAQLMEALERLTAGRTTLIIAHRLSTIRRADQILVMRDGAIVERGNHDSLVALGGEYTRMIQQGTAGTEVQ